jgi:hypothetical protein
MSYLTNCSENEAKITIGLMRELAEYKRQVLLRRQQETQECLKEAKKLRSANFLGNKGWNKDKTMRSRACLPQWMFFDKEFGKYLDSTMPVEDRRKEEEKLLDRLARDSRYGNFRTND